MLVVFTICVVLMILVGTASLIVVVASVVWRVYNNQVNQAKLDTLEVQVAKMNLVDRRTKRIKKDLDN